jgi:ketosteroid isomerase-like protein
MPGALYEQSERSIDMRQMHRSLGTLFLVVCIAGLMFGQEASNTRTNDNAGATQVKQLEDQIRTAVIKGDTSTLERYLADDYVGIGPNGMKDDKSQTIQQLKDGTVKYSAIDVTEENVRMYGNTGIYNGRGNVKLTINGQPQTADVRVTIVWMKQNGQWKRISFQATRVQPAPTGS